MSVESGTRSIIPEFVSQAIEGSAPRVLDTLFGRSPRPEFVDAFFDTRAEYERYAAEFESGDIPEYRDEAFERYRELTGKEAMGAISTETARNYYAVIRKLSPSVVVETGVCNGLSTLAILSALETNEHGRLVSIDYPFRADEPLGSFRKETFDDYGGAAIPSDKDPGWIIPDSLRGRWELRLGKSQRELPKLLPQLDRLDLFVHDSEHSHPCMMLEYELAYEWLSEGGVLLSDDINWNDAFSTFTGARNADCGEVTRGIGYVKR
jgi:hypothetical protein